MPSNDISKCGNPELCVKKESCWRYMCPSSNWQSFSDFYEPGKECEAYYSFSEPPKMLKDRQKDRQV